MIKKLFLVVFTMFSVSGLLANEIPAKTDLSSVVVFLGGAELTHTAKVDIPKGVNEIVLQNVADNFVNQSLQVGGEGNFVILSVASRKNYLQPSLRSPRYKELQDSLKILENNLGALDNQRQVLSYELELLLANKNFGGNDKTITVAELQKMSDYFNKKSTQILSDMTGIDQKKKSVTEHIAKIKKQMGEISSKLKSEATEIVVTVSASNSTKASLKASYITYDAGWNPSYDLRTVNIESPVKLDLRANVWQSTGLDWNDMNITLSTRSARQNNNKPELRRWFIDFVKEMRYDMDRAGGAMKSAAPQLSEIMVADEAESAADYMMVNETQLAVEYQPEIQYSIPSDGKQHIVQLQNYELPAEYEYYAAPKLISNAFLVANVTDWEKFNLLLGPANVYFENSYVGNSFINPSTTDEKMTFSLGRDEGIVIKRETLKDYTEEKFFGSDVERYFGYEISVRNTKSKSIKLTLEDQFPISQNEDIEIELIDTGDASVNKKDGILTWKVELNPGETVTKKFTYSVRYPEDRPINLY